MRTKPGRLEQYHIARAAVGADSGVVCAAEYSHKAGQSSMTKDVIYPALASLVQTHAAMGIRLNQKSPNSTSFVQLKHVNLGRVVTFTQDRSLVEVMQEDLCTQFDVASEDPLWRVVVLDAKTVMFAWHHAIGDGMTGLAFFRTFSNALNGSSANASGSWDEDGRGPGVIPVPPSLEMIPAIESLIDVSPPVSYILKEFTDLFTPASMTPIASAWTGGKIGTRPSPRLNLRILPFTADELTTFHTACRAHNATVTSALHSVSVAAVSASLGATKFKTIQSHIPISMRSLTGTSPDAFCCEVSEMNLLTPISAEFSWERAAELAGALRRKRSTSHIHIGLLKYLFGNYGAYFTAMFGKKRGGSVALSSLGLFENAEGAEWRVDDMCFSHCDAYIGAALGVSAVGLAGGGLTVTLTSGLQALDEDMLDSIAARFTEIVRTVSV